MDPIVLPQHEVQAWLRSTTPADPFPKALYRTDETPEYSDCVMEGSIWITTLETCRQAEGADRGDPKDGYSEYSTGYIRGGGDDPQFVALAARGDIGVVGPGKISDITIEDQQVTTYIRDAWVYCMSMLDAPEEMKGFGRSCVKIVDPYEFYIQLTTALATDVGGYQTADYDKITYLPREYAGFDESPGKLGFVKPPDRYAHQHEFRFIWQPLPEQRVIRPRLLKQAVDPLLFERVR